MSAKAFLRSLGLVLARCIGTKVTDANTGEVIGRALIIPWRGKLHVIGLENAVRVSFLPQKRLTYWRQEIGFTRHEPPNFPNVTSPSAPRDEKA